MDSQERDRLERLREEILRERRSGAEGGPHHRMNGAAQSLSRGDYSYGHVPFSDAQCLPFRGAHVASSYSSSSRLDEGESSHTLDFLDSGTCSETHRNAPKGIPSNMPVTTGRLKLQKKRTKQTPKRP
jgi:hypothetical protein